MRRTIGLVTCVLLAVLAGPLASAASAEPPAPAAQDLGVPPAEYVKTAQTLVSRLESAGTTIRTQLQAARAQRDVVKTLCLNDKLNQIDVTIRNARERKQTLDTAMERGDHEQGGHELTMLTVLRQRGDKIAADAYTCVGSNDPNRTDIGGVQPFIDPNLPQDTTDYPVNNVIVEPPACASCVK